MEGGAWVLVVMAGGLWATIITWMICITILRLKENKNDK